jgi:hypothetical protein
MKIGEHEKRLIRKLTKKGTRQSAIARALGTTPSCIGDWQKRLNLPTRVILHETEVVDLFEKGWTVERIGRRFGRRATVVVKILRSHRSRQAAKDRERSETQFRGAVRRRENSVQALALKYHVTLWRAYKIVHEVFGPNCFRPGPTKAENLPIAAAESPKPLGEPPDLATASLVGFFNRYCAGVVAPRECDAELISMFLHFAAADAPQIVTNTLAFDLARGLESLRRQAASTWVH